MSEKKNPGLLSKTLAFFLMIGLCIWGIKSCGDHYFSPEQIDKREKEAMARAEREIQDQKAEEIARVERWKPYEADQPKRKELIAQLIQRGVFRKVEFRESGATVWVDLNFLVLDFDAKQSFCSVIYAYAATNAKSEMVSVTIKDVLSGKEIGDYGQQWTGAGLKMK